VPTLLSALTSWSFGFRATLQRILRPVTRLRAYASGGSPELPQRLKMSPPPWIISSVPAASNASCSTRVPYIVRSMRANSSLLLSFCGALTIVCCSGSANADCIATAFPKGKFPRSPIYEVVACGPAEPVVELLRKSNPAWFGTFTYADGDVVVTVRAANEDARKLMREETEYWYYALGCANVRDGMRLVRPQLRELCCDVGPLSNLPCGVGGKQLLTV
jgi:hypothetical protein